jgi:hypothetical protein
LKLCYLEQHYHGLQYYHGLHHYWKKNSPLLEDLDGFLIEFNDIFGETDRVRITTTKLCFLCQGSCPASVYAADFHQLTCNVD